MLWTLDNALDFARYHSLMHCHCDAIANRSNLADSFCSGVIQTNNDALYKNMSSPLQEKPAIHALRRTPMSNHWLRGAAVPTCLVLFSVGWMDGGATSLAQDGKTGYAVVSAQGATEAEAYAAKELADYLGKMTGATFPVVPEDGAATAPGRIFVGWTDFAARHKIDAAQLGDEEWVIRTVDSDLVIVGGRPRGRGSSGIIQIHR